MEVSCQLQYPSPTFPWGEIPSPHLLNMRLDGPHGQSVGFKEKKNLLLLPKISHNSLAILMGTGSPILYSTQYILRS